MIPDDLRLVLVDAILKVPSADTEVGRTALLAGIPNSGYFQRNPEHARGDIMILILQLEENYGPSGEWRLRQFIDNLATSVAGTDLERTLRATEQELLISMRPLRVKPAEMAQVHLFDLRQPVGMCVGQLPADGGLSGFVVPGATPRLLRYFCDSLRHRGSEFGAWTRDRLAPPPAPLVIGPLHTPLSVAADHAKRVRQLLATKHVLWPAYVETTGDGNTLWQAVAATFNQPLQKHMIVVFGMPEAQTPPTGMRLLPSPRFTSSDIAKWVADVARAKAWHDSLIERWTAVIITGYTRDGPLPVDIVYDRLEQYHLLMNEYRDDEQGLLEALRVFELPGAEYATD